MVRLAVVSTILSLSTSESSPPLRPGWSVMPDEDKRKWPLTSPVLVIVTWPVSASPGTISVALRIATFGRELLWDRLPAVNVFSGLADELVKIAPDAAATTIASSNRISAPSHSLVFLPSQPSRSRALTSSAFAAAGEVSGGFVGVLIGETPFPGRTAPSPLPPGGSRKGARAPATRGRAPHRA